MRRPKFRLVTVGLLLFVVQVWSDTTCGTDFTDPASSAILADIIVEGRPRALPESGDIFNVTVQVRSIKKGADLVNGGKKPKLITIGPFGQDENKHECVGVVEKKKKYLFFLKTIPGSNKYLQLSALPVKSQKRTNRVVKKILCKGCAKAPSVRKIKNKRVKVGVSFKIRCSARAKPNPTFQWYKDGVALQNKKGTLRIKNGRKSSRLQIFKASKKDQGEYVCLAKNAEGHSNVTANVKVEVSHQSPHRKCKEQTYCLNGGTCRYMASLEKEFCECPVMYKGERCQERDPGSVGQNNPPEQAKLLHDRTIIFISIAIATLVFIAICIVSYFLARRQRKKWEARKLRKKNKDIPDTYRRLLDDVDGPHPPRPKVQCVRENSTQTDPNTDAYIPYHDPNIYPKINPYDQVDPACMPEVEMRHHAPPLGAAPRHSSQGYGGPDRMSRSSSRGSRTRLKAVSLDEGRDCEEDHPGMNEPNCIPMKELPRSYYSDGNIKAGTRPGHKRAPPSSMQNMDIPEGEMDNVKPLNAEAPVVVDLRSSTPSVSEDELKPGASPEDQPKYDKSPVKEFSQPNQSFFGNYTDSEDEATERSPLTRLHISEDEEDDPTSGPPRDKSFDSLDLDKSDSQPTVESVVTDPGTREPRNDSEPMFTNNPDSFSSSPTGSPDSHPSSSMENLVIPVLPNGTETGFSWDEHGMPVSPRHNSFPPLLNTDTQNLEDQFIHPQPPNELPLSPSGNLPYQRLLKDIREDQDPIPI